MKRLTKTKRDAYLATCRSRLSMAKGFRDKEGLDDLWKRMNDLYRGKQYDQDEMSYEDIITVNVCFSTINVIGPSVAVNTPKTVVRARKPEDFDRATITEAVVNAWWKELEILPEFQFGVQDSLIFGLGILKTGYRFVEEEVDDHEATAKKFADARKQVADFAMANPEMAGELPTDEDLAQEAVTTKLITKQDEPFVERVSIHDIYVDPEATSPRDMKWIAQKILRPINEVKADKDYRSSARAQIEADTRTPDEWHGHNEDSSVTGVSTDAQRVTVWEYYDLRNGQMCVFAESGDEFLVEPVPQPYRFGHPFLFVPNYRVPDQFYPMGELEALEPLQHELNLTRSAMFNDRKAFRRAWLYNPQAFDAAGRAALESDADNRLIPISSNTPLNEAVIQLPTATPNPQLYQDSQVIESDLQNVSGVNEYMRGGAQEVRRTATEASIIQDAANSRAADKMAKVELVIGEVSKRLITLAQQYLDSPKVARVTGPNGLDHWVHYERDDLSGEYDFEVEGGSSQPYNEQARQQQAMNMMQAFAPLAESGVVNLRNLVAHALQFGFGISDPTKFLNGEDPRMAGLGMPPQPEQTPSQALPPGASPHEAPADGGGVDPNLPAPPPDDGGGQIPPELAAMLGSSLQPGGPQPAAVG